MFYFHPIHNNVGNLSKIGVHISNCCLYEWLKNNWMKKLNRVNRPLGFQENKDLFRKMFILSVGRWGQKYLCKVSTFRLHK